MTLPPVDLVVVGAGLLERGARQRFADTGHDGCLLGLACLFGSPAHGDNRDEASWKMLGITDVMEGHQP